MIDDEEEGEEVRMVRRAGMCRNKNKNPTTQCGKFSASFRPELEQFSTNFRSVFDLNPINFRPVFDPFRPFLTNFNVVLETPLRRTSTKYTR